MTAKNKDAEDFYVVLFSNDSLKVHPENKLSAFTNKLNKPINLEGHWKVAIKDISLVNFNDSVKPATSSGLRKKREREYVDSDSTSEEGGNAGSGCSNKKVCGKRGEIITEQVRININDPPIPHYIELSKAFLQDIAYDVNKKDINFGKLLYILDQCIVDSKSTKYTAKDIKRYIRNQFEAKLNSMDFARKRKNVRREKNDFVIHV